jgi:hypothetical protein
VGDTLLLGSQSTLPYVVRPFISQLSLEDTSKDQVETQNY